jgi:hypothetical protein
VSVVYGLLAITSGASLVGSGCGGCGDRECPPGVTIWWAESELPAADDYQLCVNGLCEILEPTQDGPFWIVEPTTPPDTGDVDVTLASVDGGGAATQVAQGSARLEGRCCPAAELQATSDGQIVANARRN